MRAGKIHIGTSGWSYKHWKGTFYPPGTKGSEEFLYYQKHFDTVEINNSFYRQLPPSTFDAWRIASGKKFVFAVKANRFFTHAKKLLPDKEGLARFFTSINQLTDKLGPVLFQLPPKWKCNPGRLRQFISELPRGYRFTFEFREPTWYNDEVYSILKEFNCAFCIYELNRHISPFEVTADFVYIRLHGPGDKYQGSYSDDVLAAWAARIKEWRKRGKDVYLYFDNDDSGYAAFNGITLRGLLDQKITAPATGQLRH